MHHDPLQVGGVTVVLHSPLHQACLLAQLADVCTVIMCEHVHLQDGFGHLRGLLEVHGQQLRLKVRLIWLVGLEGVQHDRCGLLQAVLVHEDLDHLVDVDERDAILTLKEALCKVGGTLGVCGHHVLQQLRVVRLVAHSLDIGHDLVDLSKLDKALDHLLVHVRTQVDRQGKLRFQRAYNVSQLLRAFQLVLLQPLLNQLLPALLHHRPDQLHRLKGVQLVMLEERGEVMQNWRGLARRSLHALELLNRLRSSQEPAFALGSNQGRTFVVTRREKLVELPLEQLVCAWEAKTSGQHEGDVLSIRNLHKLIHDVVHDCSFVHLGRHNSSSFVHEDDAAAHF
mmetsp:Transcript_45208/g.105420  ORF Transcript_45208/g.105420 Transcript_45208/m.105420 type:complete len:340 (+) Transcript_45208:3287-4306(+)